MMTLEHFENIINTCIYETIQGCPNKANDIILSLNIDTYYKILNLLNKREYWFHDYRTKEKFNYKGVCVSWSPVLNDNKEGVIFGLIYT